MVSAGQLDLDNSPIIDQYMFTIPKAAVKSIGSGGGSIARVDELGT